MMNKPKRSEVWDVRFDPAEGDEIGKVRPAVVVSTATVGRLSLHIVVPITGWRPTFDNYDWMTKIAPQPENGLTKISVADAFQVRSLSDVRFQRKLGTISDTELTAIVDAITLCIGYNSV